ncbi:MAG: ABC transporter ATP-binding protein/permease [Planctomycetes bacterium]|nr:ABC transporter ATP-binding protein/permease [Planctomycetota bacterium]
MKGYSLFSKRLGRYKAYVLGVVASIVIVDLIGLLPPWVLGDGIDYVRKGGGDVRTFGLFAFCFVAIEVCRACMRFTWRRIAWDFSRKVELDLRNEFFAKSVKLPPAFFDGTTIGDLMSRATSDIDQVRMFFGMGLLTLFDTTTIVVTTLPILIWLNPRLTLYTTLPLPFLAVICWRIFIETHRRSRAVQEQMGDVTARVVENLNGIRVVKAYATEEIEIERFEDLSNVQVSLSLRLARIQAVFFPVFTIVLETGTLLVLWIGGSSVVRGDLTVGDFVRYTLYLGWLTGPMVGLGWTLSLYQRGIASIERLNEILLRPDPVDGASAPAATGDIEFRDLTFCFGEGRPNALEHVSFTVRAGTKVAIVGRTGSGKTTLVQLLTRLYDAPRGSIFLGGRDVRDIPAAELRKLVAFVPQDGFLFSDTLAENIGFSMETVDRAAVEAAAKAACLEEAITTFPEGYDQIVGERGVTLSGGQKQRACLARAFAADAPILILDDAFSSVDAETEDKVVANVREQGKGRTVFVISHRLSSIMDADQIVVLDKGKVVATGSHEELLKKAGVYADLWRKQQLQESLR